MTDKKPAYSITIGGIELKGLDDPSGFDISGVDELFGIKGDKGDTGETGPQGPKGDKGEDKTLKTITVSNTVTVVTTPMTASVDCLDDTKVTGGGFSRTNVPINLIASKPANNGWQISLEYPATPLGELTVYAQCAKLTDSN